MARSWPNGLRIWIVLIGMISVFLCFHTVAYAHAYVVKSAPEVNQSIGSSPKTVQIWFDEPVQAIFNALTVTNQNGNRVDLKDAHVDKRNPKLLECDLRPGIHDGLYTVNWRVISADGHPVQGVIPFQIGTGKVSAQAQQASSSGYLPGMDMISIRWLLYISMMSFLGILVFRFFILPKKLAALPAVKSRLFRILWLSWYGIAFSLILSLPLQAKIDVGITYAQAFQPQMLWKVLTSTPFGHVWMVQVTIALVILAAILLTGKLKRLTYQFSFLAGLFTIGLLVAKSLTSHATSSSQPAVPIFMDILHLSAASIWIGSLLGLVLLVPGHSLAEAGVDENGEKRELYFEAIRQFSAWGIASVFVLISTGLYAAMQQIPTTYALLHTEYGKALILKVCIFLIMFGFAVYHWICGHFGEQKSKRGIHRTIWIELGIGAIVLIVTSILTNLPTAMSTPGPIRHTNMLAEGVNATLQISPNTAGTNAFVVELKDENGKLDTDVQQVSLAFTSLDLNTGTDTVRLSKAAPGLYKGKGLYLTSAGHWDVHLHLLTGSLQDVDTDFRIVVGSPEGE